MRIIEFWYYSSERYRVDLEYYADKDGNRYVKVHAQDRKPEPDQKWSGHHKDMSEADFCQFIYRALKEHMERERATGSQEVTP